MWFRNRLLLLLSNNHGSALRAQTCKGMPYLAILTKVTHFLYPPQKCNEVFFAHATAFHQLSWKGAWRFFLNRHDRQKKHDLLGGGINRSRLKSIASLPFICIINITCLNGIGGVRCKTETRLQNMIGKKKCSYHFRKDYRAITEEVSAASSSNPSVHFILAHTRYTAKPCKLHLGDGCHIK